MAEERNRNVSFKTIEDGEEKIERINADPQF